MIRYFDSIGQISAELSITVDTYICKSRESEQLCQNQEPAVRGGIAKINACIMSRIRQDGKESERHPREPAWINE